MVGLIGQFRDAFLQITGLEFRLAVSVVVVVAGFVVGAVVAPRIVRYTGRRIRGWLVDREADIEGTVETVERRADLELPVRLVVRTLQVAVLSLMVLSLLLVWGYETVATQVTILLGASLPLLGKFALTGVLVGLAYFGTDLLEDRLSAYASASDRINAHQEGIAFRLLQLVVLISAGLSVLTLWGVNLGGLLVGAGFLGIVVGMAARQTLGSLVAGLVLMFSRPFEIGDWVEIGDEEGIVTDITIINTRMRNVSGEHVVMPNDTVGQSTVVNRTRSGRLRVSCPVGIDYEADLERAERLAVEAAESVPKVLDNPKPSVVPTAFEDSAIALDLRFWIEHPSAAKRARTRAAVIREVEARFDEAGIKIPFPQVEFSEREGTAPAERVRTDPREG